MNNAARSGVAVALAVALVLGAWLRFEPVQGDFPLNDGGLFYLMTQELRDARYVLPWFTAYNAAQIPFAYPPLAFYAAGLLADASGAPLQEVVRLLPPLVSTLTLLAFYRLAAALLGPPMQAALATLAFALLPKAYLWFVMGGGLTRAPGMLFALLLLHQLHRVCTQPGWRPVTLASVFGAATVLSHPENSWFAVQGGVLLLIACCRSRRALRDAALVLGAVVLLSSPWWLTVVHRHGWTPFLAVAHSGGYEAFFSWQSIKTFRFTDERYLTLLAVLGLLGVFVSLAQRRFLLPLWLALILALNPRNGTTPAMVPLAMLIGLAAHRLIGHGMLRLPGNVALPSQPVGGSRAPMLSMVAICLVLYSLLNARATVASVGGLRALSPDARHAMAWVRTHAPPDSRILVLDGAPWFGLDLHSEWFPVLARRASVATVQGYEWLPGLEFKTRMERYAALSACRDDLGCMERWSSNHQLRFTHVFIAHDSCCGRLRDALAASDRWRAVQQVGNYTVFQQR
ncbi:MAG: hypothetical protein H0X13_16820 [Ramlibacter sp.]|nr:hypothetical protein [Ramlibacter sp.]